MGVNSLPKTVTRQRRGCDSNPGPSAAPESSTLTTWLTWSGCPILACFRLAGYTDMASVIHKTKPKVHNVSQRQV